MYGLQIDVTAVAAIWMGGLLLLVPIAGITARFALVPLLDRVARIRASEAARQQADLLELRFARVEQQLRDLTAAAQRWTEESARGHDGIPGYR